jgi:tetratricopeptide (TPR) repeat protein
MAKWQDSYRVGQKVEVLTLGKWVPAVVTRKTATGQPEVKTLGAYPRSLGNGQLRKSDLRPVPDAVLVAPSRFGAVFDGRRPEASYIEHEAWLDLVQQLEATGAVTKDDSNSLAVANETPGQRLFQAIRRWGVLAATVTCLLFAFVATPAAAQDSRTVVEARSVFAAGQVAFDDGRYADALVYFRRSYALSRLPELLFNIALCQDRLRDADAAVASYRRYIYEMPRASNRPEVERRLEALRLAQDERALQRAREQRAAAAISPEHVADLPTEPSPSVAVYKTWWFWTIVGVAVTGAVVGIGVAASGDASLLEGDVGGVIFTLGG